MMEDNFEKYEHLRRDGVSEETACLEAIADGRDFAFQIRMLRSVFGKDIGAARDVAANALLRSW